NAGIGAIELLLQEREANGPFTDLAEMCDRVDLRRVGKRALESMIKVGVFDEWGSRLQLLDALERMMGHSGKTHDAAAVGQMSLFGGFGTGAAMDISVELLRNENEVEQVDPREVLNWEKELIGVYISEHPLQRYTDLLQSINSVTTADLDETTNGRSLTVVGLLSHLRTHVTRKGEPMAFGGLEDLQGTVELIFFPRTWKECRADIEVDQVYLVRGKVQIENGDQAKIFVDSITNNLTINQSADAPRDLPLPNEVTALSPPDEDDLSDSADDSDEVAEPQPVYRVQSNGHNGHALKSDPKPVVPTDIAAANTAVQEDLSPLSGAPPPPPNFADDDAQWYSKTPPIAGRNGNGNGRNTRPMRKSAAEPVAPPTELVEVVIEPAEETETKNPDKVVVVKVRLVGDWQKTCRELVTIAGQFKGRDSLRLVLVGHSQVIEFPNQNTNYCPELLLSMEQMPVTVHVETV
ncbi:MAG: OB-fold nucleic acid binding domain-containing protein, partial [Candidatus Promineifilaceae bacterium]